MAVRHALFKIYVLIAGRKVFLNQFFKLAYIRIGPFWSQLIDTEHQIIRNDLFSVPFFLQHFAAFTCGPIDEGAKSK